MLNIVKIISSGFDNIQRRLVKYYRYGISDTKESVESSPYGIDSNPIAGMQAIYGRTDDDTVIIGYINKKLLSAPGEFRTFSTDADGQLKFYTWLKNDGTYEIGGNVDNAVRFKPVQQMVSDLNQFLNTELAKISTGIGAAGGTYTPGTAELNVNDAKINEVKTL